MKLKVCVVIPCYKVKNKIIQFIKKINSLKQKLEFNNITFIRSEEHV